MFEGNSATKSTEEWLKQAEDLVPLAVAKIGEVKAFIGRWKNISNKVEQLPSTLSDLASHPCFTKKFPMQGAVAGCGSYSPGNGKAGH